jgi:hypothetical protein
MNNTETLITILDDDEAKKRRQKGIPRSANEGEFLARRLQGNVITFYDLAQTNVGTVDNPIWNDHPILKTPSYSVAVATETGSFLGATYTFENFGESDYTNYLNLLTSYGAVSEWKHIFKKLELELSSPNSLSYPATYPTGMRFEGSDNALHTIMERTINSDIETPDGKANRQYYLTSSSLFWDKKGLEYKNLTKLRYRHIIGQGDWIPGSSDDTSLYKITEVNDPNAPDVSGFAIRGKIDVYLFPLPGLFIAVTALSPIAFNLPNANAGFNVMFAYQILPRQYYHRYVDPYSLLSTDATTAAFLDYQSNRAGMGASFWQRIGVFPTAAISEHPISATTWGTGNYSYLGLIDNIGSRSFYRAGAATFNSSGSGQRFLRIGIILTAVIHANGKFYYVWAKELDEYGNVASLVTNDVFPYSARSSDYRG